MFSSSSHARRGHAVDFLRPSRALIHFALLSDSREERKGDCFIDVCTGSEISNGKNGGGIGFGVRNNVCTEENDILKITIIRG